MSAHMTLYGHILRMNEEFQRFKTRGKKNKQEEQTDQDDKNRLGKM